MMMMMMTAQEGSSSTSTAIRRGSFTAFLIISTLWASAAAAHPHPVAIGKLPAEKLPNEAGANIYLVRSKRYEDQRGSSSGYAYQTQHRGPTSYVQVQTSYGPLKSAAEQQVYAKPADLPLPPITKHLVKQGVDTGTSAAEVFANYEGPTHMESLAEDTVDEDEGVDEDHKHLPTRHHGDDDDDDDDNGEEKDVVEHGSSHEDASSSKHGSQVASGHNSNENVDKGTSGKHTVAHNAGSDSSADAHKASSHEDAGHHAAGQAARSSSKGASHARATSHKKGSKTTGYHKTYRKDEYKKEHTFYDDKDVKGHFDTYGSGHKEHGSKEGGFRRAGHHQSAHAEGEHSAKGSFDKGRYAHHDAGYQARQGGEEYHKDAADYDAADGKHSYREKTY